MSSSSLTLAVVIASKGRPTELARWAHYLDLQNEKPDLLVFSVESASDLPPASEMPSDAVILSGPAGSSVQRNRALDFVLDRCDLIAFFDDDYVPSTSCIQDIKKFFGRHLDIVGANGHLYFDGINSAGIDWQSALKLNELHRDSRNAAECVEKDLDGLYGCNMVFRSATVRDIRFDECLPLYGWQEDIDFASRAKKRGRLVKTNAFAGVHMGVKSARTSGVRFGYSQVANPLYLSSKGTMAYHYALMLILRNAAKNHLRTLYPEPWIDRLGRVKGNWLALRDIFNRRLHPKRILEL